MKYLVIIFLCLFAFSCERDLFSDPSLTVKNTFSTDIYNVRIGLSKNIGDDEVYYKGIIYSGVITSYHSSRIFFSEFFPRNEIIFFSFITNTSQRWATYKAYTLFHGDDIIVSLDKNSVMKVRR